ASFLADEDWERSVEAVAPFSHGGTSALPIGIAQRAEHAAGFKTAPLAVSR
ncbi:unnamed protein product, partial [marine sediment metagenome]